MTPFQRRLICLGIVVVVVALIGLVLGRIQTSDAVLARERLKQLHVGMSRTEVREIMADIRVGSYADNFDWWEVKPDYWIGAMYYWPEDVFDRPDHLNMVVERIHVNLHRKKHSLDWLLESFGYPKVTSIPDEFPDNPIFIETSSRQ